MALEADGGQHYTKEVKKEDAARTRTLEIHGIQVLRFSDRDILMNIEGVCEVILKAAANLKISPSPGSSPRGERI